MILPSQAVPIPRTRVRHSVSTQADGIRPAEGEKFWTFCKKTGNHGFMLISAEEPDVTGFSQIVRTRFPCNEQSKKWLPVTKELLPFEWSIDARIDD